MSTRSQCDESNRRSLAMLDVIGTATGTRVRVGGGLCFGMTWEDRFAYLRPLHEAPLENHAAQSLRVSRIGPSLKKLSEAIVGTSSRTSHAQPILVGRWTKIKE
jgi:hypothetical protein